MQKISITGFNGREKSITISGLEDGESELFESSIGNCNWIMADEDGRLMSIPKYKDLPDPIEDEEMLPFWSKPNVGDENIETKFNETPVDISGHPDPQIMISSLCGYHYSPRNYQVQAEKLKGFGFKQMRSPRDPSGRFIEHWFLYGSWAAKGQLETFIKTELKDAKPDKRLDSIVGFLCRNVRFGSLEVAYQRAAAVMND